MVVVSCSGTMICTGASGSNQTQGSNLGSIGQDVGQDRFDNALDTVRKQTIRDSVITTRSQSNENKGWLGETKYIGNH